MLKTKCSDCNSWVYSPILTEITETECPDCGSTFSINDLYVSTGPFSVYRDALLKNLQKYTRLLKGAREELEEFKTHSLGDKNDTESIATLENFVSGLEELLSGCRTRLRIPVKNTIVKYSTDTIPRQGTLINISSTGICIDACEEINKLRNGSFVILIIDNMNTVDTIYLHGEVVWIGTKKSSNRMGIRFINSEPEVEQRIRTFITEEFTQQPNTLNQKREIKKDQSS